MSSILNDVKKVLNLPPSYTAFDLDVIMHINSTLSKLNQLGIGPEEGYMIEGETEEWSDFLGDDLRLNNVKQYVYLSVRLVFDPPATSFHLTAIQEEIKELGYRINVTRESYAWRDPNPPARKAVVPAIDGGGP